MSDRRAMYGKRDAFWHCSYCGNHEPAQDEYELGDHEPCCLCGEGTAKVMTLKEGARYESEIARGIRSPKKSYS